MQETTEYQCTIVSIVPFPIIEEKPGLFPGRFSIPASIKNNPEILHVGKSVHYVYLDQDRESMQIRTSPEEVAASIVNDFVSSQLGIDEKSKPGIFFIPVKKTITEVKEECRVELAQAETSQNRWFLNCCKIADDDWNRYHQHRVISDTQRKMAELIGWTQDKHEWLSAVVNSQDSKCPACGTPIMFGIVICPNCKVILDKEKAKQFQFAGA